MGMTDDMLYIFHNKKLPDHQLNFDYNITDTYGRPI